MNKKKYVVLVCHHAATIYSTVSDAAIAAGVTRKTMANGLNSEGYWYGKNGFSAFRAELVKSKQGGQRSKFTHLARQNE